MENTFGILPKNPEKPFYPQQKKRKWNVDPKKFVSVRSKGSLKTVHCFCSGENNPVKGSKQLRHTDTQTHTHIHKHGKLFCCGENNLAKGSKQLRHTKMAMFFMGIEEAVSYQKMTK